MVVSDDASSVLSESENVLVFEQSIEVVACLCAFHLFIN